MNSKLDWEEVCERLWGPDWIAPLSEVLHVNRRTVERWRSGKGQIPENVEQMIVTMTPEPTLSRHLGSLIRRLAAGETIRDFRDDHAAMGDAIRRVAALQTTSHLVRLAPPSADDDDQPGED